MWVGGDGALGGGGGAGGHCCECAPKQGAEEGPRGGRRAFEERGEAAAARHEEDAEEPDVRPPLGELLQHPEEPLVEEEPVRLIDDEDRGPGAGVRARSGVSLPGAARRGAVGEERAPRVERRRGPLQLCDAGSEPAVDVCGARGARRSPTVMRCGHGVATNECAHPPSLREP